MAEGNDQEKQIMTVIFTANYFSKIFVYSYLTSRVRIPPTLLCDTYSKKVARFIYCVYGVEVSTFNLLKDSGSNPDIKKCHDFKEK